VLKHGKRVVDDLTDWLVPEDTYNSTHRPSLPRAFSAIARAYLYFTSDSKKISAGAPWRYVAEIKRAAISGRNAQRDI
jgi:hypothetical protein